MEQTISIIVPVFNAETTLKRCIESLVTQTYRNIEILLIDDGSTDCSLSICKEYANIDNRIQVISQTNKGVSVTRNVGLDAACGDYIMFCDSDDWVEPDWCYTMLNNFDDKNFIMCGEYIEGKQEIFPQKVCADNNAKEKVKRTEFYSLRNKMFNVPWNKIFLKSVIDYNRIRFSEKLTNGEDLLFNVNYLSCIPGNIILLEKCCYHYTLPNENSLSRKVPSDYFEQCNFLLNSLEELIPKIGIMDKKYYAKFYTDFFYEYQRYLIGVLMNYDTSLYQKWCLGNKVMRSREYRICIINAELNYNLISIFLYKMKACFPLWLWINIRSRINGKNFRVGD